MKKILVISPHPDDLDFGCSGTIAGLIEKGNRVSYLIVSDGSKGVHKGAHTSKQLVEVRKKEQKKAARVVGAKEVYFLGLKDGEIEDTKDLRKKLVRYIRQLKPEIIFSFDPANKAFDSFPRYHRDHRKVAEAAFDAIYPASGNKAFFPELIKQGYLPYQPKEAWFFAGNKPDKIVDISKTIGRKIEALSCHQSQITDRKKLEERIREWARRIGGKRYRYAEGFRIVKL
ncbi:MAG: PIG-L deacetylase family protein [bacterium]|nr:PIG-L deacetylase family protein [bacterium]